MPLLRQAVDGRMTERLMGVVHCGCGGVRAALHGVRAGLAANGLRGIRGVRDRHGAGALDDTCRAAVKALARRVRA